jgi:hypothetical protein
VRLSDTSWPCCLKSSKKRRSRGTRLNLIAS